MTGEKSSSVIASDAPSAPFRLTRFFSIFSLVGIAIVTSALLWSYRQLTIEHLIEHEGRANAELTRAFSNTLWREYRDFVLVSGSSDRETLLANPTLDRLHDDITTMMQGLHAVKIKIYSLTGNTVYSTDQAQIGADKLSLIHI